MKIRYFLVRYLANLQFAILLLLTIAGISTIGSIIEQNQTPEYYQTNYSPELGKIFTDEIIFKLGLDHIFQTWWFILLLILFGTSLMCCTFLQQFPILTAARKVKFYTLKQNFTNLPFRTKSVSLPNGSFIRTLNSARYQSFQRAKGIYANKGLIGRISPIIVHFSMVLVLLGTVLASQSGFIAQEFVPETEVFHVQNLLSTNRNSFVPQVSGRVNDFWISYKDDERISQFYTDLSILDANGKELKRETIYVNHPLKYQGLTFYQTDWDVLGLRVKLADNQVYQVPVLKPNKKIWFSWIPKLDKLQNFSDSGYILLNTSIRGSVPIYTEDGQLIAKSEFNEALVSSDKAKFCDFINASGIQIKADPGLSLIYTGFFFLLISIVLSYLSYSQVWLSCFCNELSIGGFTNRAKIQFEFEILNLGLRFQKLEKLLSAISV